MPGETFQTLKSKATKQAKKSGMSQSAAENYGSAMAANAAIQGGSINVDKRGNIAQVQPDDFMSPYDDPSRARLPDDHPIHTYPSGRDKFDFEGIIEEAGKVKNLDSLIEERQEAEKIKQDRGGVYNPQTGEVEYPKKTKLFEGLGSLDDISGIKGIFTRPEIQRLTPAQLRRVKKILANYQKLGINNPLKLRSLMMSNIAGGIFGKDQTYSDLDGNIVDPANIIDKGDGRLMALVDGEYVDVRRTREGAIDQMKETFGDDIIKRLKMHNPEIYYPSLGGYLPGSTGELETLGKEATLKKNQDGKYITADGRIIPKEQAEKYNKMIFEARNLSDPKTRYTGLGSFMGEEPWVGDRSADEYRQQVSYGEGIPSIATAPTPFTDVNNNGILDNLEVAQATTTPVTATIPVTGVPSLTPTTIDYASMGPQYGGYVNQGISDPRFASYFQNLNLFPRRS